MTPFRAASLGLSGCSATTQDLSVCQVLCALEFMRNATIEARVKTCLLAGVGLTFGGHPAALMPFECLSRERASAMACKPFNSLRTSGPEGAIPESDFRSIP